MKTFLFLCLATIAVIVWAAVAFSFFQEKFTQDFQALKVKNREILFEVALVSDSHNDNAKLAKALEIAKERNVKFVIGLGDYTDIGTVDELNQAKQVFDASGLDYYVTVGDHDLWDSRNQGKVALANFTNIFGKSSHHLDTSALFSINPEFAEGVDIQNLLFVILDDSDLYSGITTADWNLLNETVQTESRLTFIFAHKTPYHPDSVHIMGQDNQKVAGQAEEFLKILENKTKPCHSESFASLEGKLREESQQDRSFASVQDDKLCPAIDGFFSGDLHFFAQFQSPAGSVKITTVGALDVERNFQGPQFAILKIFDDYSWEVEDFEVR